MNDFGNCIVLKGAIISIFIFILPMDLNEDMIDHKETFSNANVYKYIHVP